MSDGREYIHKELLPINLGYQNSIKQVLESTGIVEVVAGGEIIGNNSAAKREGVKLQAAGVELTIFNFVKGTGWCTADALMDFSYDRLERFISLARDQHVQMLRGWTAECLNPMNSMIFATVAGSW
jgi:L-fucose isomerase-like protein